MRMGCPALPLLVRPPKIREGSMRTNSTGSMSRTAMAARSFLPCCAAAEMDLLVLMAPWMV